MLNINSTKISSLFIYLFTPLCLFLSFNKHSHDKIDSYQGVIWADASGYYVYLPIWFIYGNNSAKFPSDIEERTGLGFKLDSNSGKVITKYPSGIALMQAPFFLVAHLLSGPSHYESSGFSLIYHWAIMIAGAIYSCLGLFFLCKFLSYFFSSKISFLTTIILFISTNLYYYTIGASGMSHVYSFFIFSALLYFFPRLFKSQKPLLFALFGSLAGLAILIRPTNILIFPLLLLLQYPEFPELKTRIKLIAEKKALLGLMITISIIPFIPQLVYWKEISGHWIHYSYSGEGFSNWLSPEILKVWFSSNNGLIPYAPILILCLISIVIMTVKKNINGLLIGVFFLLISYVFSSWWCWWYGCSFGSRSFVEYYAILVFPLAWLLNQLKSKLALSIVVMFIGICIWINLDITYYYDGCFPGGEWDYQAYLALFLND